MSERATKTPGPPIVDDQNAMSGDAKCPFSNGARKHNLAETPSNASWWPESTEPEALEPALTALQSHGRGVQLR